MSIAPFSFREFSSGDGSIAAPVNTKGFEITGRKKAPAEPPPPPPPIFSEQELRAAERDSYQKGFLSGIAEGKQQAESVQAQVDRDLTTLVGNFTAQLAPLFSVYQHLLTEQAKLLPNMAHAIAKKVAAEALSENAYPVVEELCLRCIRSMCHMPKLIVTLHESLAPRLQDKLAASLRSLQINGEIEVIGDAHIALDHCRVEWKDGGMVRDTEQLWQHVEQVVASMVASAHNEAAAVCEAIVQSQPSS